MPFKRAGALSNQHNHMLLSQNQTTHPTNSSVEDNETKAVSIGGVRNSLESHQYQPTDKSGLGQPRALRKQAQASGFAHSSVQQSHNYQVKMRQAQLNNGNAHSRGITTQRAERKKDEQEPLNPSKKQMSSQYQSMTHTTSVRSPKRAGTST